MSLSRARSLVEIGDKGNSLISHFRLQGLGEKTRTGRYWRDLLRSSRSRGDVDSGKRQMGSDRKHGGERIGKTLLLTEYGGHEYGRRESTVSKMASRAPLEEWGFLGTVVQ